MDEKVIIVNKECGQTPLDCINKVKKINPKLAHLPLTYAGRLDPLAKGVLVILVGDECLKKDEYLNLDKEYEVTVLFGFATDTYDVMGRATKVSDVGRPIVGRPTSEIERFIGRIRQSYPPYSSRTVNGKPLYKWAREGKLDEIIIPSHEVYVEKIEIIKEDDIKGKDLLEKINKDVNSVGGDFRQREILKLWQDLLINKEEEKYKTITLKISCGSGVYVRGIANDLGLALGVPALALDIIRTKVGKYIV